MKTEFLFWGEQGVIEHRGMKMANKMSFSTILLTLFRTPCCSQCRCSPEICRNSYKHVLKTCNLTETTFTLNHQHDILKATCFNKTELKLYNLLSWLTSVWLSVWKLKLLQQFCHRGNHFLFFSGAFHLCWMKISPLTVKGNKKQMPSVSCNLSSAIRRWCSEEQQCSCQVTCRLHQPPLQLTGRHMAPPPPPPAAAIRSSWYLPGVEASNILWLYAWSCE